MALTLDTAVARFPELGGSAQDIFALVQVGAVASSRQTLVGHGAGVARRPLCLALCLDASSSMRGPRFALALQAARDVVHSLGPDDRFAVVTFDRNARTVLGATTLDADGQHTASRTLDRLTTGVGTNLSAGWREAAEGLLRAMVPGAVRRVLVLTDGYPSRGETQPEVLRAMVAEGAARGVETSMLGLGDGIDETLCTSLARAGEGRFHYLRDEAGLGELIAAEVEGARSLVARDVTVGIALAARVDRAEVLHRFPCQAEGEGGRTLRVRVGALGRDVPRSVLVQLHVRDVATDTVLGTAQAQGVSVSPREVPASGVTRPGFAMGDSLPQGSRDAAMVSSPMHLTLAGDGTESARARVAAELLALRTAAEIRSAWDALDTGDRTAMLRRLERARKLRQVLVARGLVTAAQVEALPDIEAVTAAMNANEAQAREARRKFASWAHNTQSSFVGLGRTDGVVPIKPRG